MYQPGDDVRRMDWAVTARTTHPHVRQMIADRELETWLVVDMSASLDFGTAGLREARPGGGGRGGDHVPQQRRRQPARRDRSPTATTITRVPARSGRQHEQTLLRTIATMPKAPVGVRGDLATAIDALRRPERRRGMAVIISDFLGPINWMRPLRAIAGPPRGARHRGARPARRRTARRRRRRSCRTPNPGSPASSPSTSSCATTSPRPPRRTAPRWRARCAAAGRRC